MSKKTEPSFEDYCKCFAGVFRKHTHDESRSFFTCYIRDAIHDYLDASSERRMYLMERGAREETIGCFIAKALLTQGWTEDQVGEYADIQQYRVNNAEDYSGLGFVDALYAADYSHDAFGREANGARYAWILAGSPDITDCLEPSPYDD